MLPLLNRHWSVDPMQTHGTKTHTTAHAYNSKFISFYGASEIHTPKTLENTRITFLSGDSPPTWDRDSTSGGATPTRSPSERPLPRVKSALSRLGQLCTGLGRRRRGVSNVHGRDHRPARAAPCSSAISDSETLQTLQTKREAGEIASSATVLAVNGRKCTN